MESLIVARVTRAHGLNGGLVLWLETDRPTEVFTPGRQLAVHSPPAGLPERLTVAEAQPHGRGWLLLTDELADRTVAERFAGVELSVPRDELSAPEEGEWFVHELVGLSVVDEDGAALGSITEVYDAPAGAMLGVTAEGRERLVPFRPEMVVEVDMENGRVTVNLPPGLLDV